jgi:(p)ppGpp synthase/HD superfamily hydrolase
MLLTMRFDEALRLAADLHRDQTRKGGDVPYLAHLMAVAASILEHGGDEDTAIAALLHDAVEDQGGAATAELIRTRFGDRVAELVLHCSDSVTAAPTEKAPWRARKTAYLARLLEADAAVALISAADKLHNLTATLRDVRRDGPATLQRFAEPDQLVWYYGAVAEALARHHDLAVVRELRERASELLNLLEASAMLGEPQDADRDNPDYSPEIREELRELLKETPPGEWGELALCPGPFGCPFATEEAAISAGVQETFCGGCRVIHVYGPR